MTLITESAELRSLCEKLKHEEYITVDTEFLRDKFYYPKLCLIQVASESCEFAVDPLAEGIELEPLFKIFNDKRIMKVFHSARQDIEIILSMSGKVPEPLFDTQVAAMVCGFGASASYATLVAEITKKHIDKSSRFTDWSRRPLTEKQLDYAISDVTYLRDVYKKLKKNLHEAKRESWLEEEMSVLINPSTYQINPDEAWKKIKARGSSRRFLGIIRELAKWRELTAQQSNRPKTFILKDPALLEIAAVAPKTAQELQNIRGVGGMKKSMEDEILAAIEYAKNLPESELPEKPKAPKHTKPNESLIELLKVLLKAKCTEAHVAEKLVATSEDLNKIATSSDSTMSVFHGWRYEIFGKYAQDLKNGKISLSAQDGKILIINR